MTMRHFRAGMLALAILVLPVFAQAAQMHGHGDGHGGNPVGPGTADDHNMMTMGDKSYAGKIGPWNGEVWVMDMKAAMASSGMAAQGAMKNTHHVSVVIPDPATKKMLSVGKGSVMVTSPDGSNATFPLMVVQGHLGADVNMPKPGTYRIAVEVESGGKKGSSTFTYKAKG